jgi:hypothetical protein
MGRYWISAGSLIAFLFSLAFAGATSVASLKLTASPAASALGDTCIFLHNGELTRVSKAEFRAGLESASISSLTNTSPTNYVGQTITAVTVSWTLSGSDITSQTLTDCSPALGDRTHAFTGLSLTSDKYYTLTITDGVTPSSASTGVFFYIQKYYGTSADASPNAGDIQSGSTIWSYQNATYRSLGSTNVTGGGNYIFYSYPAAWGNIQLFVNGFLSTWNKTTVSLTNAYGDTRNYYVYTSPTTIVGAITLLATAN